MSGPSHSSSMHACGAAVMSSPLKSAPMPSLHHTCSGGGPVILLQSSVHEAARCSGSAHLRCCCHRCRCECLFHRTEDARLLNRVVARAAATAGFTDDFLDAMACWDEQHGQAMQQAEALAAAGTHFTWASRPAEATIVDIFSRWVGEVWGGLVLGMWDILAVQWAAVQAAGFGCLGAALRSQLRL